MPPVRIVLSPLASEIQPAIESFIKANSAAAAQLQSSTPDDGAAALSHAIAYGIAKALSGPTFKAALAAGVATPGGGPVGTLISTVLMGTAFEI